MLLLMAMPTLGSYVPPIVYWLLLYTYKDQLLLMQLLQTLLFFRGAERMHYTNI